jgi:hypothetical protein
MEHRLSSEILKHEYVCAGAKLLYAVLYTDSGQAFNTEFVSSNKRLSMIMSVSKRTVQRYLYELDLFNMVIVLGRYHDRRISLTDPKDWNNEPLI